jgi:signal transduction histidine kinase
MTGLHRVSCCSIWLFGGIAAELGTLNAQLWWLHNSIEPKTDFLCIVHSAWAHSTIARLFYFVATFLLGYFVHRLRARRIEASLLALFHKRLSERDLLSKDLNDTLLQTIEASKLIADEALDSSAEPVRMREAMGRLSYWLGQATEQGQTALSSMRMVSYDENDLASSFQRAADECLIHRSLDFKLSVTGRSKDMHPMLRDEVYRLGYEAISNVCKYNRANRLEVVLTYGSDFCLQVKSSGPPVGSALGDVRSDEHPDLYGMQRRAKRFGATLGLTTSSSSDVELRLTIPGSIIFSNGSSPLPQWLIHLWHRLRFRKNNPT